jgi:phosphoglycerol transferase MdoB-like AlkP superfamily enzyme
VTEGQNTQKAPFFTKRRIWLLVVFILLVGWAVINFSHGHRAYSIFIIAFFLISFLLPKPSFALVLISVISYMFLSSVSLPALAEIRTTINNSVEHPKEPLENLFTPHTGLDVLPVQVQQMLGLIDDHNLTSYRLSPMVSADYHTVQRIVESAWPIRMDEESPYIFTDPDEVQKYSACELVDQAEDVTLVNCD